MCVCAYVHVYVYMCVSIYIYIYICICDYLFIYFILFFSKSRLSEGYYLLPKSKPGSVQVSVLIQDIQ